MMRRWTVGVALLVALMAGCDPKPPAVNVAKPIDTGKTAAEDEFKVPAKPDASDKAGADLLKKLLDAHTGGSPDKVNQFRECSYTRTGKVEGPIGQMAEWRMGVRWPDHYRLRSELSDGSAIKVTLAFGVHPGGGWTRAGDAGGKLKAEPGVTQNVQSQKNEDSVSLLFALGDPKAVVTRAAEFDTTGDKAELALHVWTPGIGYARVGVNAKTSLLARFHYLGREADTPTTSKEVPKEVLVHDTTDINGVKLPSKLSVKASGRLKGEWNQLTVDPAKPDDKDFAGP